MENLAELEWERKKNLGEGAGKASRIGDFCAAKLEKSGSGSTRSKSRQLYIEVHMWCVNDEPVVS